MGELKTIPLPFDQGLTQQEAVEWLDSSASSSGVVNGNFTKAGAVDKRLGMELACSASNYLTNQGSAASFAMTTGLQAVSWSKSALGAVGLDTNGLASLYSVLDDHTGMVGLGPVPTPRVLRRGVPGAATVSSVTTTPAMVDVPGVGGVGVMRYLFYVSGNQVFMTVVNADTGDVISVPTPFFTQSGGFINALPNSIQAIYCPNAAAANQVVVMLYFQGAAQIAGYLVNTTTQAISNGLAPTSYLAADITPFVGDTNGGFILFYLNSSDVYGYIYYTSGFTASHSGTIESAAGMNNYTFPLLVCANRGSTERISFLYEYKPTSTTWAIRWVLLLGDGTFNVSLSANTILSGSTGTNPQPSLMGQVRIAAAQWFVDYTYSIVPSSVPWANSALVVTQGVYGTLQSGLGFTRRGNLPLGFVPVAKPFVVSGATGTIAYQPCICSLGVNLASAPASGTLTTEQCTLYLLGFQNLSFSQPCMPVATVAPRQVDPSIGYFLALSSAAPPFCSALSGTRFALGIKTVGEDNPGAGQILGATWSAEFRFDQASQLLNYQTVEVSGAGHIAAGVPMIGDGTTVGEDSFFYYPEFAAVVIATGGTTIPVGVYEFAVVYKYFDATGQLYRSAPAFTNQVTTTSGGHPMTVMFPPLSVTYRTLVQAGQVYAEIYRTQAGGGTFYLETEIVADSTTLTTLSYTSVLTDAALGTSTILYTTGGILDCINAPSFSCTVQHWNRVWGVDETLRTIWFTKAFTPGETPGYNEALTISYPEDITALISLDDKLLIGTLSGLAVVYGQGPADTGQGSDLTLPQPIACDAGPLDWRSCVVFPGGLLYRSQTGFMLCDRALNVSWIGKDVVDTLALYPTVLSAALVPYSTQVRFTCANAAGATTTLVYDYLASKWVQHLYTFQAAGVSSSVFTKPTAQNAATYATITLDGNIWQERAATNSLAYLDDDTSGAQHFSPTTVTTAWVKIQGVQGYQRARQVQFFFEELDDCGVMMSFAVNYTSSTVQSKTWSSAVVDDLPNKLVMQHVGAKYMKQMALQVTLTDAAGTSLTTGQGARFVSLSIELESLGATYRQVPVAGRA